MVGDQKVVLAILSADLMQANDEVGIVPGVLFYGEDGSVIEERWSARVSSCLTPRTAVWRRTFCQLCGRHRRPVDG